MSKSSIILRELNKITSPDIKQIDDHTYFIPKYTPVSFAAGDKYLLKLDASLLTKNGDSILVNNWNNGTFPKYEYMKAYIVKSLGDKIYTSAIYYDFANQLDLDEEWNGWLPIKKVQKVKKL